MNIVCERFLGGTIEVPASEREFRPSIHGIVISGFHLRLERFRANGRRALPGGGIEKGG